jgi:transposase
VPDRQVLCGILFVLHTGIQWDYLSQELGFGSGMTCWRRQAAWNEAGVWDQLHLVLLRKLRAAKQLDWSPAVIDSSHVRAVRRGPKAEPARSTPRPGSEHHVVTDAEVIPLAVSLRSARRGLPLLRWTPSRLVPDNLKTGVDKPDLYDPKINKTYAELGTHYGALVDSARALRPTGKPRGRAPYALHP